MTSFALKNMQRITIELLTEDAIQRVKKLEEQNIVRVITPAIQKKKSRRKWAGSLSKETARRMLESLDKSRNEWNRI